MSVVRVGFASPDIDDAFVVGLDDSGKGIHEVLEHVVGILLVRAAPAHPSE
jgi:hypothetical protein